MTTINRVFKDIDLSFTRNPATNDIYTKSGNAAIKQAMKNLILLNSYEKPYHPDIGGGIYKMLFENFELGGTEHLLRENIKTVLRNYEPRVDVIEVKIENQYDTNSLVISIHYKIKNTLQLDDLTVFLQISR